MQNEAQYDLDRKAAKTSALFSEDLSPNPSAVERAKFEYSPFGNIFTKGSKEDKKKGLFKRLKHIEDKSEEQLKIIGNKTGIKSQIDLFDEELTLEAIALIEEIKSIEDSVDYDK